MAAGRAAQIVRYRGGVTAAIFAMLCTLPAAQVYAASDTTAYPSRPIRMVVPFSPGGTSDTLARILGQKMTEAWGQQVVVDGRPGASGIIGTEVAARAPADGYTLMHGNLSQFAINPSLFNKLSYDTLRDFVPLSLVGSAPQLLVVNPAVPAKSVAELIQLTKTKPGTFNFGSGGAGTLAYIGGEMFKSMAGIDIVHISYKGTVLALNDLVGGQVQLMFSDMPIALPHGYAAAGDRIAGVAREEIDALLDARRHHKIVVRVQQHELGVYFFQRGGHLVEEPDVFRIREDFQLQCRIFARARGDELAVLA